MSSKTQLVCAVSGASAAVAVCVLLRKRRRLCHATVTQLSVYPVKSCRGIALERAELDEGGIRHDREWMIVRSAAQVDEQGNVGMLTIRDYPQMATIQPSFTTSGKLVLSTDDGKSLVVDVDDRGPELKAIVWRSQIIGRDQGDAVGDFLTAFLKCSELPVRLVRAEKWRNLSDDTKHAPLVAHERDGGGVCRFPDWTQLSLVSNQSLAWLNAQHGIRGISNARMRMNIVVDATEAFAEDSWDTFCVGETACRFVKQCGRCLVPTVDPFNGARDSTLEPLKVLKRLHSGLYPHLPPGSDTQAFFGINMRHFYTPGQVICVGDRVSVSRLRRW